MKQPCVSFRDIKNRSRQPSNRAVWHTKMAPKIRRPATKLPTSAAAANGSSGTSSPTTAMSPVEPGGDKPVGKSTSLYLFQMLLTAIGIYVCFFSWGILHERVAHHKHIVDGKPTKFKYFLISTLLSGVCTSITALGCLIALHVLGWPVRFVKADLTKFAFMGGTMTFAGPLGLTAAKQLSYPIYLTVKMCKMVPSVIVGALWYRFRYTGLKYLAVVLISGGVLGFSLLSNQEDTQVGVQTATDDASAGIVFDKTFAIAVAVAFFGMTLDGYTVSTQDALHRDSKDLHSLQMMLGAGLAQTAWCLASLGFAELLPESAHTSVIKPELQAAAHFFHEAPQALYDVVALGLMNSLGQVFVLTGVGLFGGLTMVALMTTRKVGSVFISIAAFGHSVSTAQWLALGAVIVGVVVDTVDGVRNKNKKARHAAAATAGGKSKAH